MLRILMLLTGTREERSDSAPGFEQVVEPFYLLQDAGAELVVASPRGGAPPYRDGRRSGRRDAAVERFYADRLARDAISDTLRLADIHLEDFDGGICVGALEDSPALGDANGGLALVTALLAAGKPVAVAPGDDRLAAGGPLQGLLIIGDQPRSPSRASKALLGALSAADLKPPEPPAAPQERSTR